MANALYNFGKESLLLGDISWDTDDIRVILVDTADYTVNLATDQFLSIIGAPARVATSGAFTGKTNADGVADAADVTLSAVTGDPAEALVIYKHTGVEATSILIAYIDSGTNLPVTPNGGDIVIQWNGSGIFAI